MALTRAARAAAAAAAAFGPPESAEGASTQVKAPLTRSTRGRGRSSSTQKYVAGRQPACKDTNKTTSEDENSNTGCSKSRIRSETMSEVPSSINIVDHSNTCTKSNTSNTSASETNGSSSSTTHESVSTAAVPRVTLSLLRQRPRPPVPAPSQAAEGNGAKQAIPAAFSRLSLEPHNLEPLLRPVQEGPFRRSQKGGERAFLDTTAAPGVVTLRPVEPVRSLLASCSSSSSSKPAALGWGANAKPVRDGKKVMNAVAAGEAPPRATDAALRQGSCQGPSAVSSCVEDIRKEERQQRKEKEKQQLSKWFSMPLTELSPQLLRELRVLQLRGHASAKVFGNKTKGPLVPMQRQKNKVGTPTHTAYLQVATVVNGGLRGVGGGLESQAAGTANKGAGRRGGPSSLLHSMLNDPEVHSWTKRKYREIQQINSNRHSHHWSGKNKKKQKK